MIRENKLYEDKISRRFKKHGFFTGYDAERYADKTRVLSRLPLLCVWQWGDKSLPAVGSREIERAIKDAFIESSASAVLVPDGKSNPRKFFVMTERGRSLSGLYIWTLTHGGGAARPSSEYRIQLTSVTPPLLENPDGPTLLLGYEPKAQCFAGFDVKKHLTFSSQSPSIQVNINTIREAISNGFAFSRKGNDELALGFRPDNMLVYTLNSKSLHESGTDAEISELLSKKGGFKLITDDDVNSLAPERKRVVTKFLRLARNRDFRRKVMEAYEQKCCVTGLQFRLVDAAHVLPVGAPGSSDEVHNGLCLAPTYHRAYDLGLIYLTEDHKMMLRPEKQHELTQLGLGGGLEDFKLPLNKPIFLPRNRAQWPDVNFIRSANRFRGI